MKNSVSFQKQNACIGLSAKVMCVMLQLLLPVYPLLCDGGVVVVGVVGHFFNQVKEGWNVDGRDTSGGTLCGYFKVPHLLSQMNGPYNKMRRIALLLSL